MHAYLHEVFIELNVIYGTESKYPSIVFLVIVEKYYVPFGHIKL